MSYIAGMFLMNMEEEVRVGLCTPLFPRDKQIEHYIGLYTQRRVFSVFSWWEIKESFFFFFILQRIIFQIVKVFKPKVTEIKGSSVMS